MKPMNRSPLSLVVLALATFASGCAASRREAYVQEKASGYVYHKPIAEVWPQVMTLLKEKDLPLRASPGAYEVSTDWNMVGAPSALGTNYVRYLVRGKQPTAVSCSVEVFKQNRVETSQSPAAARATQGEKPNGIDSSNLQRDTELEWELLQRVDPEAAKSLRAEAEQAIK